VSGQPSPVVLAVLAAFGLGFNILAARHAYRLPANGFIALLMAIAPATAMGSALFSDPTGPTPAGRFAVALILLPFTIAYAMHARREAAQRRTALAACVVAWCVPVPIAYWLKQSLAAI
jgi:hypothetical protein